MGVRLRNKRGAAQEQSEALPGDLPARAAGRKKSATGAALSNGLTDTGSVLQVEETASLALYVRYPLKTIEAF